MPISTPIISAKAKLLITADGTFRRGGLLPLKHDADYALRDTPEIENVIVEMEGILEAAAIGIPDEKSGEVVKIFAVRTDTSITEQDVLEYCRENLTGYKRPKKVEFRDELPKTNVGKILRRALRD